MAKRPSKRGRAAAKADGIKGPNLGGFGVRIPLPTRPQNCPMLGRELRISSQFAMFLKHLAKQLRSQSGGRTVHPSCQDPRDKTAGQLPTPKGRRVRGRSPGSKNRKIHKEQGRPSGAPDTGASLGGKHA